MANLEHEIRYTEEADLSYLMEWLSDPGDLQYYPMSLGKELELGAKNWIGFARYKCSLTALVDKKPCGIATLYLMPYKKVSHHCLFYMIVDKEHRRKGIGQSLLKNLLNLGQKYFLLESMHAEVYEGSPMLPLLKKQGFSEFAIQEHFIKLDNKYLSRTLLEYVF